MGGVEKLNIKHKPSNHRRKQRIFLKGKKNQKSPCLEALRCLLDTQREHDKTGQACRGRQVAAKDNCLCSRPGQPVTCHLGGSSGEGSRERVDRGQSGVNHFQE